MTVNEHQKEHHHQHHQHLQHVGNVRKDKKIIQIPLEDVLINASVTATLTVMAMAATITTQTSLFAIRVT